MLHLSTGIAAENKIHPATEWGSRSERHELEWNGEANEEIRDRNGINLRGRRRCCRRRYPGSPASAAGSGGGISGGGKGSDRQRSRRGSGSGADRHQGLTRQTNGSTPLVRSVFS